MGDSDPGVVTSEALSLDQIGLILQGAYPLDYEDGDNSVITQLDFNACPDGRWRVVVVGGAWSDTEGSMLSLGVVRNGSRHIIGASDVGGDLAGVPTIVSQITLKKAFILRPGDYIRILDEYGASAAIEGAIGYRDVFPE